ncbi:regulatory protein BlaR1 [Oxobacter pfennigii]|uniref:Regulatory protein BlaR1 n=2 Tax=Oxobacter pfennigii TaxID=36849 RepID=A0A0P8WX75_9CLOT|nr:regulatory protein BlaR1 [Oxobacter pfennigii]
MPRLYRNTLAPTPMLIGMLRPVILLPDREYSEIQLQNILLHELTHLRRHDLIVKWLSVLEGELHWFNPVVYLVRREIDRACELACDGAVIKCLDTVGRQNYGDTLIAMVAEAKTPKTVLSTTMCEEKKALKERLGAIMKSKNFTRKVLIFSSVFFAATLFTTVLLGASGMQKSSPNDGNSSIESIAWEVINNEILNYEQTSEVEIIDSKISFLELVNEFDNLADRTIYVYLLEYRLLPKDLSKVILAGGMRIDEKGWLTEWSSMGQPLIVVFEQEGNAELIGLLRTAEISEKNGGLEAAVKALLEENGFNLSFGESPDTPRPLLF